MYTHVRVYVLILFVDLAPAVALTTNKKQTQRDARIAYIAQIIMPLIFPANWTEAIPCRHTADTKCNSAG